MLQSSGRIASECSVVCDSTVLPHPAHDIHPIIGLYWGTPSPPRSPLSHGDVRAIAKWKFLCYEQSALRADSERTSALSSGASALRGRCIRAAFASLPLVIDHPVGRVPEAPQPPLAPTARTDHGVPTRALYVPLSRGQPGNDRDGALDHTLHLGHGLVHQDLALRNRLGGLHPVRPDALEAFGPRVW